MEKKSWLLYKNRKTKKWDTVPEMKDYVYRMMDYYFDAENEPMFKSRDKIIKDLIESYGRVPKEVLQFMEYLSTVSNDSNIKGINKMSKIQKISNNKSKKMGLSSKKIIATSQLYDKYLNPHYRGLKKNPLEGWFEIIGPVEFIDPDDLKKDKDSTKDNTAGEKKEAQSNISVEPIHKPEVEEYPVVYYDKSQYGEPYFVDEIIDEIQMNWNNIELNSDAIKDDIVNRFGEMPDEVSDFLSNFSDEFNPKMAKKKKKKKDWDPNPWAVCHTTVDKGKHPDKYERCVKEVKKKQK